MRIDVIIFGNSKAFIEMHMRIWMLCTIFCVFCVSSGNGKLNVNRKWNNLYVHSAHIPYFVLQFIWHQSDGNKIYRCHDFHCAYFLKFKTKIMFNSTIANECGFHCLYLKRQQHIKAALCGTCFSERKTHFG